MAVSRRTLRLAEHLRVYLSGQVDWTIRQIVDAWVRAWEVLDREWQAAVDELVATDRDGLWPSPAQVLRAATVQAALAQTTQSVVRLADFAGVTVVTAAREVSAETAFWQARLIASQLPANYTPGQELPDKLGDQALEAIVERTMEQIESWKRPLPEDQGDIMRRELIRGVAIGDNPRNAARRMMKRTEHAFNGGLNRALTLARTEVLDAHRSAAAAYQYDRDDVLQGWAWGAKLDGHTCPSCWAQHGRVYPLWQTGPHDHQCGRCGRLPVTRPWTDLGIDIDEPESVLADSYEAFRALSHGDQLKILGPVRLQALNAGVLGWEELSVRRTTPGWRESFVPISVGEARRRLLRPV